MTLNLWPSFAPVVNNDGTIGTVALTDGRPSGAELA